MRIGVIQASSQREKNDLLCQCVRQAAARCHRDDEIVNFGIFGDEDAVYSYVKTAETRSPCRWD